MSLAVHISSADTEFVGHLEPLMDENIYLTVAPEEKLPPAGTRILVKGVPTESDLAACTGLEALIIPWAGVPRATRDLLGRYPRIAVHNLHHNALTVAEMAIGLMFACAKQVPYFDRRLRRGDWRPRYADPSVQLLKGKRVLVLGYGAIGSRIAAWCDVLGMRVKAVRRSAPTSDDHAPVQVHASVELPALLPEADVLFISLPWTPETDGLLGRHELGQLPKGAIVVNIGRGTIVDEGALYEALRDHRITAGLDVWYNYPRSMADRSHTSPSKYPFAALENVVMTPHLAGHHDAIEQSRARFLAEMLNAAGRGEALPYRVDIQRGY